MKYVVANNNGQYTSLDSDAPIRLENGAILKIGDAAPDLYYGDSIEIYATYGGWHVVEFIGLCKNYTVTVNVSMEVAEGSAADSMASRYGPHTLVDCVEKPDGLLSKKIGLVDYGNKEATT